MAISPFFYTGSVESLILDCYRLAKIYGRDPDDFLSKPLSAIQRHMKWTDKLNQIQNPDEDDDL